MYQERTSSSAEAAMGLNQPPHWSARRREEEVSKSVSDSGCLVVFSSATRAHCDQRARVFATACSDEQKTTRRVVLRSSRQNPKQNPKHDPKQNPKHSHGGGKRTFPRRK